MRRFPRLAGGLCALALFVMAGTAHASLIQSLAVSDSLGGENEFTGTGQIEFDDLGGSDPSGIVDFSFSPTTTGPLITESLPTFSKDNIVFVNWSIDSEWQLTDFSLVAKVETSDRIFGIGLDLVTNANFSVGTCERRGNSFNANYVCVRELDEDGSFGAGSALTNRDLSTEAVHDVPEPAPLALMLIALSVFGLAALRRPVSETRFYSCARWRRRR